MSNYDNEIGKGDISFPAIILLIVLAIVLFSVFFIKVENKENGNIGFDECKNQCVVQTGVEMWDYYPDYTFDGTKKECKRVCKDATGTNLNINLNK